MGGADSVKMAPAGFQVMVVSADAGGLFEDNAAFHGVGLEQDVDERRVEILDGTFRVSVDESVPKSE